MRRSKLISLILLISSVLGILAIGVWQFTQTRKYTYLTHISWAERVSRRLSTERNSATIWLDDLRGSSKAEVRRELYGQPDFIGAYWFDVRTHEFEKWIMSDYKVLLDSPDPRLIVAQLKAAEKGGLHYGPLVFLKPSICASVALPIDSRHTLVVIQAVPRLTKILEEESSWSHVYADLFDTGGHRLFMGGESGISEGGMKNVRQRAESGELSGRVDLSRKNAWQWLGSYHAVRDLDAVLVVAEATPRVYIPFVLFVVGIIAALWLVALPFRAREDLRRAREASDLADFARRVDHFVHGKELALQEPPYPFRELTPIVTSLRWLMPQWKNAESIPQEYGLERHLLSLLLESLPEGILFFNAQGMVQMGNEMGKAFLALQQEAGREFKMMTGVQVPRGFLEPYAEPVFTGQQPNLGKEVEVGWADGKHLYRVWVECVDVDGTVMGFIIVIRDITFRKQWESVQEQMLSGITHDLRGPLSAIMGYIDLLKRQIKDGPPKALEYLAMARDAGNRLTQMISDILDVVRFEQGKIEMDVQALSVDQMFERIKNIFGVTATQKGVTLRLKLESLGILASGDPKLLERVLDNLVGNAIKFTPPGGTITVTASRHKLRTVFAVTDTGRGIPKEAQSRIFDKFQQVRPGDRSGGYGLGLAVVKFIVEAHKGEIRVESELDKGSTFTFWIPDQAVTSRVDPSPEASAGG